MNRGILASACLALAPLAAGCTQSSTAPAPPQVINTPETKAGEGKPQQKGGAPKLGTTDASPY